MYFPYKNEYRIFIFWFIYSFIHMWIHCLGHLSPYPDLHPLSLPPTSLTYRNNVFCPLLQFCWREDISNIKKDIVFLLVWDKDSYIEIPSIASMHLCITTRIESSLPDLYTTSQSPSHSDLCQFKFTVLSPLQ
jgi:hypothetical protein